MFFYSCQNEKSKKPILASKTDSIQKIRQDTFNIRNPDNDTNALQNDIGLDTIEVAQTKKHMGISIVYPKLSPKEIPAISKWIGELINEERSYFRKMIKDEIVEYDKMIHLDRGWSMWIRPTLLYKNQKLLSFTLLSGSGYTGMSAGFGYRTINYDLERKKKIGLGDYFILSTPADTSFLANMIKGAINQDINVKFYLEIGHDDIIFGFDNTSVYFFCDKYHPWGWGIYSVEKKYIVDHINPLYR